MSNPNSPFGLKPVKHISGAPWNGQTLTCWIPTTYGTALYVGDPVVLAGSASTDGYYPTVGIATAGAGNPILGAIVDLDPLPTNLSKIYWAASDTPGRIVRVCCDPTVLYEVQADVTAVATYTDVGALANLSAGSGGSTATGLSGWVLATTSMTTTSTYQVRIMGLVPKSDNDMASTYAKWYVLINLHQLFTPATNASAGTTILGSLGV